MRPPYEFRIEDGKTFLFLDGKKLPGQMNVTCEQDVVMSANGVAKVTMTVMASMKRQDKEQEESIPQYPFHPEPPCG